jgi:glycosyltransferase involved in cell wall biosynthesis
MSDERLRLLFLTSLPPIPTWGTAMTYHRHLVERSDFALVVATDDPQIRNFPHAYPVFCIEEPRLLGRLCRTRFSLWFHSWKQLFAGRFPSSGLLRAARQFDPDVVLTVAGSWFWTTMLAQQVSQALRVPLAGSFNDWFDYSILIHPRFRRVLERRFRRFYSECDLALCTSEGMHEELGPHRNVHILYPAGARLEKGSEALAGARTYGRAFTVAFAGNLGNWYGTMLERLIGEAWRGRSPVEFRLYGSNPSWSPEFDAEIRRRGLYPGHLPFSELGREIAKADALLLLMGFGEECAVIERTSFKTKFLDYLSFQRPILLWGPNYCSAVRYAREFDCADVCTEPDAKAFLDRILAVRRMPERQHILVSNARKMYEDRFHPDKIHSGFVRLIQQTVESFRAGSTVCSN